jgi:CRP-like cAMP-binding protein
VVKHAGTPDAVTLHTLGVGDFIDELGFIDGTEPYASKLAIGKARVLGLEREQLESLLATEPHIVYNVMRAIVRTVHQIQRRLSMQSVDCQLHLQARVLTLAQRVRRLAAYGCAS